MVFTVDALSAAYFQEMDSVCTLVERPHPQCDHADSELILLMLRDESKGDPPSPPPQPPPSPSDNRMILFGIEEAVDVVGISNCYRTPDTLMHCDTQVALCGWF